MKKLTHNEQIHILYILKTNILHCVKMKFINNTLGVLDTFDKMVLEEVGNQDSTGTFISEYTKTYLKHMDLCKLDIQGKDYKKYLESIDIISECVKDPDFVGEFFKIVFAYISKSKRFREIYG